MKGRDNKMEKKKLSVSTGLCYAGGDVGCNIVFGMIGTLLTLFYTDYVGISAATVGLVMLLSRCFYCTAYDGSGSVDLYFCNL